MKNKLIADLIAIFLGFIGIHNFYLGNIKKAVIQICLILPSPFLIYLSIFLGLDVAHSTTNMTLGYFSVFLLSISIVAILVGCFLWVWDVIRIFTNNYPN